MANYRDGQKSSNTEVGGVALSLPTADDNQQIVKAPVEKMDLDGS
jgi:hypothetical protein